MLSHKDAIKNLFFFIMVFLAGCSFSYDKVVIQPTDVPNFNLSVIKKLPLSVAVMLPDKSETLEGQWTGSNIVTSWPVSVPTGHFIDSAARKAYPMLFDKVAFLNSNDYRSGFDMYLIPSIFSATHRIKPLDNSFNPTNEYIAQVSTKINVMDPKGRSIATKSFETNSLKKYKTFSNMTESSFQPIISETFAEAVGKAIYKSGELLLHDETVHAYADKLALPTDSEHAAKSYQAGKPQTGQTQSGHTNIDTKTISDIATNIPTGKPAGKYDVAVVIGNQSYSASGTPNVDFAVNDARIVREYLTKALGYDPANIIYLENATLTKLYEVFGTKDDHRGKLFKWVKPGQSRVFIYYVGHGAPDQESGEAYFVPVDANPQYIRTGGYKLSTFYENLSKIPAAKKTVVIDACFSGSSPNGQLFKGVSGLVARMKSEPKAAIATDMLFTSAGMDQVASWYPEKGHSLFTYFFLKGLQGEADTNKDGKITMAEMKAYLSDQVPYMARRLTGNEQQPQFIGNEKDEVSTYTR